MSLRQTIIGKREKVIPMEIPEWECTIYLRKWNGRTRKRFYEFSKETSDETKMLDSTYLLCLWSMSDEDGNLLFTESEIDLLVEKEFDVIDRIAVRVLQINGITAEAIEEKKRSLRQTENSTSTTPSPVISE